MQGKAGWRFAGRRDAGCQLSRRLWARLWCAPVHQDVLVLGVSPGGLMVAASVAAGVQAELDAVTVCPIASPGRFAHSIGAVTATGPPVLVRRSLYRAGMSAASMVSAVSAARQQARAHELALRGYVPPALIAGRTVIVVDDGLGIGVNALAVLRHVRRHRPERLIFATPVCAKGFAVALATLTDEVISVVSPPGVTFAGSFYADLAPVGDDEVRPLLSAARRPKLSRAMARIPIMRQIRLPHRH